MKLSKVFKPTKGSKAYSYQANRRRRNKDNSFDDLMGLTALATAPIWGPAALLLKKKKKK